MNPPSKKERLKRDPKRGPKRDPKRNPKKKVSDFQDPEIPTELGFQKVRYPARNGEPHNSSDGHRRLRENPENRCDTQENAATKFTQSRYFNEKGRAASKRKSLTPKKSNQSR
jgi:hypothetical protein